MRVPRLKELLSVPPRLPSFSSADGASESPMLSPAFSRTTSCSSFEKETELPLVGKKKPGPMPPRNILPGISLRLGWRSCCGFRPSRRAVWTACALFGLLAVAVLVTIRSFHGTQKQLYTGYFNGIGTLVHAQNYIPEQHLQNRESRLEKPANQSMWTIPQFSPVAVNPYPDYESEEYLASHRGVPVQDCFLDQQETILPPDVYAYKGIPQNMPLPEFGSYAELGLDDGYCWERFGRFSPYGYGYPAEEGGFGLAETSESMGSEKVFKAMSQRNGKPIDYRAISWGDAQRRCYEKNKGRFRESSVELNMAQERQRIARNAARDTQPQSSQDEDTAGYVKRHAFLIRAWTGLEWSEHFIITLRAIVAELSLRAGGEYDVFILLHVRDETEPIWADPTVYQRVIEEHVPEEFWAMTVLWSTPMMELFYPGPFGETVENASGGSIHAVYRSSHLAFMWFAKQHPDYDFYWNWEADIRLVGHYYDFFDSVGRWARRQPRKGMWERASQYYIPALHGSWDDFTRATALETEAAAAEAAAAEDEAEPLRPGAGPGVAQDHSPIWGPVTFPSNGLLPPPPSTRPPRPYTADAYEWGVGEDADLVTFTPLFDPDRHGWVFRDDVTGYGAASSSSSSSPSSQSLSPPPPAPPPSSPPRRSAIVAAGRLSARLVRLMNDEVVRARHNAFTEMFPPTVALHHGLKAVAAPHPLYFDGPWRHPSGLPPPGPASVRSSSNSRSSRSGNTTFTNDQNTAGASNRARQPAAAEGGGGYFAPDLRSLDQVFNRPSGPGASVFAAGGEPHQLGTTYYFHATFAGRLWRRWFGYVDDIGDAAHRAAVRDRTGTSKGGSADERVGSGRMCLRTTLLHPVKRDANTLT